MNGKTGPCLIREHFPDGIYVCIGNQSAFSELFHSLGGFVRQNMTSVSLGSFKLPRSSLFKSLRSSSMRFYLRHSTLLKKVITNKVLIIDNVPVI